MVQNGEIWSWHDIEKQGLDKQGLDKHDLVKHGFKNMFLKNLALINMVLIIFWNYLLMVLFCLKIGIPKCLQSCIDSQSWLCQKIIFIFSLKIFFIPFLSQMISFYWGLVLRALNFAVNTCPPKKPPILSLQLWNSTTWLTWKILH